MAVRSVNVTLINKTGWPLMQTSTETSSGEWSANLAAPNTVAATGPGATVIFQTESDGVLTGTEAGVVYQVMDNNPQGTTSWILLNWQNPYIGSTTMTVQMSTTPIDANGNQLNGGGGPGGFNIPPPLSPYECAGGGSVQNADGTDSGFNWGSYVIPLVGPISIFLNAGNVAHADAGALIQPKATDLSTWGKRHGQDVSKGIRALRPPKGSLRALMQLPP